MATDGAATQGSLLDVGGLVFDGRYRVEERIAEGGFAVVYKAWQLALERRVALKVLKPPRYRDEISRAEFRDKFAAEARTIARLRHPHIVDVYDFSVSTLPSGELAPWMALEWLEGETLAVHLAQRRAAGERGREPREAIDFLRPAMEALAHAHQQGIVHRDVKPANIMVTTTVHGPALRVLDFGIAKLMLDDRSPDTGLTRTDSAPAFSPAYAAPEQVTFSRTGPWTDVHALGLILTELLTDQAAFSDPDPEAHMFEQVMAQRRPTPASKGHDVGPTEAILAKALSLSPRDRWRNAGELLAALDEAKGLPARPAVPRPVRTTRFRSLAALALLAGGVGAAIVLRGGSPRPPAAPALTTPPVAPPAAAEVAPAPPAAAPAVLPAVAPAPVAVARRRQDRKEKKAAVAPAARPSPLGDGRDLFDDTK